MAEMAKKLHFLKSGTEQTAKAYSTTTEAGSPYITNVIDGTTCYAPLADASDSRATVGRVLKNGTTYAIATMSKPAYAEKSWTTAGTYTFTVPAGVTRIRVAVCGGGGSGIAIRHAGNPGTWYGGVGGASSFGSLMKTTPPSYGAGIARIVDDSGESISYSLEPVPYTCGSPNGRNGTYGGLKAVSGGAGFALSFTLTNGSYGKGGDAKGALGIGGASGSSGGYDTGYVNVTAGSTYTITVGAGGSKASSGTATNYYGTGNSGFVLIAYGGDI